MDKYCIKCGSELNDGDKFCWKCGQYVNHYGQEENNHKRNKKKWAILFSALVIAVVAAVIIIVMRDSESDSFNGALYADSTNDPKNTDMTTSGLGTDGGELIGIDDDVEAAAANEFGIDFDISNLYGTWEYIGYYIDTGYEKGELPSGELIQSGYYRYAPIEDGAKIVFNNNGQMYHIPGDSIWGYDYYNVVEWFGYYDIYYEGYGGSTETYNMINEDTILLKRSAVEHEEIPPTVELYKKVSDDMDPTVINRNGTAEPNIFKEWNTWKYYPAEYDGIEGYACEIDFDDPLRRMQFLSNTQVLIGDSIYLAGAFDDPIWPKEFVGQGDGVHVSIQIVHPDELRVYMSRENEEDIVLYYNGVWG